LALCDFVYTVILLLAISRYEDLCIFAGSVESGTISIL
jgi:hypothetical protein